MNEEQIRTFLAIVRRGSFSGAANDLYMSQPAVTHRVKTLEEELGVSLFVRDRARVQLTSAGTAFAKEAQAIHNAFCRAHSSMLPFTQSNTIRIGFPSAMIIGECRAFFAVMNLAEHDEKLHLHSVLLEDSKQNVHKLTDGEVDLVFSDIDPTVYTSSLFGKRVLFNCYAYACMHRGHPLAQKSEIAPEELQNELICRFRDSTHFSAQFSKMMRTVPLQNVTDEFDTIAQAVAHLTPQEGVVLTNARWMNSPDFVYLPLKNIPVMRIGVIWLKRNANPALRPLVDRITLLPSTIWRV